MELGALLENEGFTELRLIRRGAFELSIAQTWTDVDWSQFQERFDTDSVPNHEGRCLNDAAARALIAKSGADRALAELEHLMSQGRHQMMTLKVEPRLGMRAALFVHSSVLGHNNGLHAIRAGGFRRHERAEPELHVFTDGLNLGRAMSFKNAAADLPLGGCKMTVQSDPIAIDDAARLGFLAYTIESGRFLTGPDMGFLPDHADAMRARFTRHVTGGRHGVLGPTGTPTALGCFLAIQQAAEIWFGWRGLAGKTAAIQGLGAVGRPLAVHLARAGMKTFASDPDPRAIEETREMVPELQVVPPDRILTLPCDVLAPCAVGGVIDEAMIGKLSCQMLYGSANNILAAASVGEELRLAQLLARRDVLFQVEWTHNTAGVMSGFEEYVRGEEATEDHLHPRLVRVCRDGTRSLLEEARATGETPTSIAYRRVEHRIHGGEQ